MAVAELKLTDTIGQMRDKINEIINTVKYSSETVTEIKLYSTGDNPEDYVTITYDGTNVLIRNQTDVQVSLGQ